MPLGNDTRHRVIPSIARPVRATVFRPGRGVAKYARQAVTGQRSELPADARPSYRSYIVISTVSREQATIGPKNKYIVNSSIPTPPLAQRTNIKAAFNSEAEHQTPHIQINTILSNFYL
jgi:hypothetical protein